MSVHNADLPSSVATSNDYIRRGKPFISSGDLYILARNIPFKVCSFFLARDSGYWRTIVEELYSSDDAPGSSQSRPFYLNEDPDDVAEFLSIPYTRRFNIYDQTPNKWGAIFRLADQWDAPGMRNLAISQIQSTPMDMAEKIRVFLTYNVPKEVYYPLVETMASHDELPEDLLLIFVGETSMEEFDGIPEGAEFPQAPPPSLDGNNVYPIPSVTSISTESTVAEGSSRLTSISKDENDSPSPVSSVPNISSVSCSEGEEVIVSLTGGGDCEPEDVQQEEIVDDIRPSCGDLSDRWVIVDGNQNDDQSLSHPSMRRPFMLHDFIIPYCLLVSVMAAIIA